MDDEQAVPLDRDCRDGRTAGKTLSWWDNLKDETPNFEGFMIFPPISFPTRNGYLLLVTMASCCSMKGAGMMHDGSGLLVRTLLSLSRGLLVMS
jgi:hypothetical protein